ILYLVVSSNGFGRAIEMVRRQFGTSTFSLVACMVSPSATLFVQFAPWNDAAYLAASQTRATIHEYEKDGNTFLEFVVQINTGTKPWGVLRLGLSLDPLNREISKTRKELMKESKNRLSTNQQAGFS
ncbi:MAG: hypothetical protein QGI94_05775, partial [Candidatus Scalindua sp.]|nr:hypothetical protein [Candidatus Scalindua sp.]